MLWERDIMTLKQLQYVVTVAEEGNITSAAKRLYIAQPSLTAAIHELEKEFGVTIFIRSNKGIKLTSEGEEFLGYARQVLDQTELIEERYAGKESGKLKFYVSAQHYSFAVEAFVELLKRSGADKYEFHMRETQTFNIIDDVAHLRSEIGILYLNKFNEEVIRKTLKDNRLNIFLINLIPPASYGFYIISSDFMTKILYMAVYYSFVHKGIKIPQKVQEHFPTENSSRISGKCMKYIKLTGSKLHLPSVYSYFHRICINDYISADKRIILSHICRIITSEQCIYFTDKNRH